MPSCPRGLSRASEADAAVGGCWVQGFSPELRSEASVTSSCILLFVQRILCIGRYIGDMQKEMAFIFRLDKPFRKGGQTQPSLCACSSSRQVTESVLCVESGLGSGKVSP